MAKSRSCVNFVEIVSISFGAFKPRSCVNFIEIVCRFRRDRVLISPGNILVFAGVRLRFEKSSNQAKTDAVGDVTNTIRIENNREKQSTQYLMRFGNVPTSSGQGRERFY